MTSKAISAAIDNGVVAARERLQRYGIATDAGHVDLQVEISDLSQEQRTALVDEGLTVTVRSRRALSEHATEAGVPIEVLAAVTTDLHASPWDRSILRTEVEQEVDAELSRTLGITVQDAVHERDDPLFRSVRAAADAIASRHAFVEAAAAERRVAARQREHEAPGRKRDIEFEVRVFPTALADLNERLDDLVELAYIDTDAASKVHSVWHDPKLLVSEIGGESALALRELGAHEAVVRYVSNAAESHFGDAKRMTWSEFVNDREGDRSQLPQQRVETAELDARDQKVDPNRRVSSEWEVRALRSPQAKLVRSAERRGNIPADAAHKMLSHPAMRVFEDAHGRGVKFPESLLQLKQGFRKGTFGNLPKCAEEILLADALIIAQPKLVATGLDRGRVNLILADLNETIDSDLAQYRAPQAEQDAPRPEVEQSFTERVSDTLEHLEFTQRATELRQAGRIDHGTESTLLSMAADSNDLDEFKTRLHAGGRELMGATEYRYLESALLTPEGRRPETWQESAAYVRAYGTDESSSSQQLGTMHHEQHMSSAPSYS